MVYKLNTGWYRNTEHHSWELERATMFTRQTRGVYGSVVIAGKGSLSFDLHWHS